MSIRLIAGDARDVLPTLAADSVQCVVTSPPYYGLRDYGTALWDGGDAACDHKAAAGGSNGGLNSGLAAAAERCDGNVRNLSGPRASRQDTVYRATCGKCGAVRIDRQIGLEATPDEYLATMVAVFREVKRVLRPDGTCWVNMGDSYNANQGSGFNGNAGKPTASPKVFTGLAAKQLLLMPARLALALQADGWWVRSDIIIAKRNPMPESARDRPTSAHEHVFLLTKNSRYFFDPDAVREEQSENTNSRGTKWRDGNMPKIAEAGSGVKNNRSFQAAMADLPAGSGRNIRNVWDISTEAFGGAHFATMPTSVVERCIRAGTSEKGCCSVCGKPWRRQTSVSYTDAGNGNNNMKRKGGGDYEAAMSSRPYEVRKLKDVETTGWEPGCDHGAEVVPCTILDPFIGSGTTALVADRLQRDAIGIELNTAYTEMAMERCRADAPLFADMHPPPAEDPEDERMRDLFAEAGE